MPLRRLQGEPHHQVPVPLEFDVVVPLLAQLTLLLEKLASLWEKLALTKLDVPLPIE